MSKVWLVAETDFIEDGLDGVMVIKADTEEEAIEKGIRRFAEVDSKRENFREYVNEGKDCPAFSINETLYQVDRKHSYEITREQYMDNVNKLFAGNEIFKKQYLDYVNGRENQNPNFSDEFYEFVCIRLCELHEWADFEAREIEL
ncbi:hypothetical protein [Virgibacillus sp. SK37]|uniref:hypothetical protein n=1 Tax=Virgibacillus sp. SK37 TaxID=403957 RepID=UPI0004D13BFC|nr:hypothetical protein [Virgibacillus sp. SK37]AIF45409.1 hypothetical protein X953_10020 [Virgibacillus sp. SK37]